MRTQSLFLFSSLILSVSAAARLYPRATNTTTGNSTSSACAGNTASTRNTWCDYDISTDYSTTVPTTNVTREYFWDINELTLAPDGVSRTVYAINGSIPGPTIVADWGDTVVIHVTNNLANAKNGTSIHFHGIRQNYTNQMDGVVSITQCPTAPGNTMTYTWRAVQYGTTWYHSHIGVQAWEGVAGAILINGPASANYDVDKGTVFLSDWSHETADELFIQAESSGPPTLDNGLINGTNVYGTAGSRFTTAFTSGQSYRLRLINGAIDTHFKFMIDNHTLEVIASDLVPIKPYSTTVLNIAIGQRYDVVVTANQASVAQNFWMRAIPQVACSDNNSTQNIKGIVYYGSTASTPTTSAYNYTDACEDESSSNLVPYISKSALTQTYDETEDVTLGFNSDNYFRWLLNGTDMEVQWASPTLLQITDNATTFSNHSNVIQLPEKDEWAYVVVQSTLPIPHPIHLHGHDFLLLGRGTGTFDSATASLTLTNPPRRDTALLPASGFLVVAFQTDNPGAWLMHCHIGWHTTEGFALQFVERYSEIASTVDQTSLKSNCDAWSSYATSASIKMEDSGI